MLDVNFFTYRAAIAAPHNATNRSDMLDARKWWKPHTTGPWTGACTARAGEAGQTSLPDWMKAQLDEYFIPYYAHYHTLPAAQFFTHALMATSRVHMIKHIHMATHTHRASRTHMAAHVRTTTHVYMTTVCTPTRHTQYNDRPFMA
jgi:hypothetical protein